MKLSLLFVFSFCLAAASSFAQPENWSPYQFNNGVQISFPAPPVVIDTTNNARMALLDTANVYLFAAEEFFANYRRGKPVKTIV